VDGAITVAADVLEVLPRLDDAAFDLAVWDLYDGPRAVTAALDLASMTQLLRAVRSGGFALLNVSDAVPFDVVRPVAAALRLIADDVVVLAEPSTLRGRRSGNCVLVARLGSPLPVEEIARVAAAAPVRARVVAGDDLTRFVGAAEPGTPATPLPQPSEARGRAFL
jgi:hypothetical protein